MQNHDLTKPSAKRLLFIYPNAKTFTGHHVTLVSKF